ncbi:MAG: hypothetical protein ACTSUF_02135 [Candidatus Heimdallarchaeaceae archaeon]
MSNSKTKVSITVTSTWPLHLFREWDDDCKKNFNDCRWLKMWNDHLAAKRERTIEVLMNEINALKARLDSLENKKNEKPLTLAGGVGND